MRVALWPREAEPDKPVLSERKYAILETLAEYRQAVAISSHVGVLSEVLTWNLLGQLLSTTSRQLCLLSMVVDWPCVICMT